MVDKAVETAEEIFETVRTKAGPYVETAKEKAGPYVGKAGPYLDRAADLAAKGVDRATAEVDKVTGGKYHDSLDAMNHKAGSFFERHHRTGPTPPAGPTSTGPATSTPPESGGTGSTS